MSLVCEAKGSVSVWCGYCYSNVRGRASYKGHIGYRAARPVYAESLAMAIKKRDNGSAPGEGGGRAVAGKWGKDYPVLWEFLTLAKYEDGSPRTLPTLTLFVDLTCVKLCLNDRDQGLTGWMAAETVEGAFLLLEKHLKEDKLEWKTSQQGGGRKKR